MADVMVTVTLGESTPSLESVAAILGVPISALSQRFGVVLIDLIAFKYTVLIDEAYEKKISPDACAGPFSNPMMSPYSIETLTGCNYGCHVGESISHVKACCRICDHCGLRIRIEDAKNHPCPGVTWHLESE